MRTFLFFISILTALATAVFANDKPEKTHYTQIETRVMDIEGDVVVFPANGVFVGEGGVIVRHIDSGDLDFIIGELEVVSISRSIARAKLLPFKYLEQKFLPTPLGSPSIGDKVLFRTFANKAMVIAPSLAHYEAIIANIKNVEFIHPDLFAAYLFNDGHPDPSAAQFSDFCKAHSVGILFIEHSAGVAMLDCATFKHIGNVSVKLTPESTTQVPFFSRIKEIQSGSIISKLTPVGTKNYYKYFDEMVEKAHP